MPNRMLWVLVAVVVAAALLFAPFFFLRSANPIAVLETSMGTIKIELDARRAPISVANFRRYAEEKHYDGTIFHRVIDKVKIEGGGYTPGHFGPDRRKDRFPPIKNESDNGLKNERGTIAMARSKAPDSATSEFFINVVDNPDLDRENAKDKVGYAVFGRVIDGMDVIERIRRVKTDISEVGNMQNVPVTPVVIQSVRIER